MNIYLRYASPVIVLVTLYGIGVLLYNMYSVMGMDMMTIPEITVTPAVYYATMIEQLIYRIGFCLLATLIMLDMIKK